MRKVQVMMHERDISDSCDGHNGSRMADYWISGPE